MYSLVGLAISPDCVTHDTASSFFDSPSLLFASPDYHLRCQFNQVFRTFSTKGANRVLLWGSPVLRIGLQAGTAPELHEYWISAIERCFIKFNNLTSFHQNYFVETDLTDSNIHPFYEKFCNILIKKFYRELKL